MSSSGLMAFISVYKPKPGLKDRSARAILFHFARDWTISILFSPIFFTGNDTGLSIPFRSSFIPLPDSTNNGDVTLLSLRAPASSFSNKSFAALMAFSVSC